MTCASFGCKAAKARSTPAASSLVWPPVYSLGPGGKPMSQTSLAELLSLASPPVAIAFVDAVPPGVPHVSAVEPAGCGYWRRAAAGEVFFTVADDHKRCAVGAHTHNVTLSPAEKQELMGLVQTMVGLSYLKMEDVPQIPTRKTALQVAVYAPLAAAPVLPDVMLVRGNARQLMLLAEAAQALHRQPRLHRRRRH
ncbi:MAG: hypothetical protein DMD89_06155 [Candidatus Rokuibacteriota bacterium]|nr:MAG: hypothetical protein DMD89_06155 [Candidatus Rokubacteria bacterium]